MSEQLPTAKEIFEKAKEVGYDSLGICADPELQTILDLQDLSQRIEALLTYRQNLWKSLGLVT